MTPSLAHPPAVLITGASSGIGEGCLRALDRRGFRVFAGVRRPEDGERLRQAGSGRVAPLLVDVTDPGLISAARQTIARAVGAAGLAGLVNSAGIAVHGPLEFVPLESLRRQLEVNVTGQVAVLQQMLPLVRAARGRIVNISSVSGLAAAPLFGPYAASKHALEAITDSLRVELRRWGIAVSLVEPGCVDTPIWGKSRSAWDDLARRLPPEAEALYAADIRAVCRATDAMAASAIPVERVVRAVVHALTARRPKTRYPVGLNAHLIARLWGLMSDRLHDRLMRRALGLGR
jgi:NAD(P)-dependent dehydrogenase (short-subunit alcohol dehydrogenase family)